MRVITGDETGLVKFIDFSARKSRKWGRQTRERSVMQLGWAGPAEDRESAVACAYKCVRLRRASRAVRFHARIAARSGEIEVWKPNTQTQLCSIKGVGSSLVGLEADFEAQ